MLVYIKEWEKNVKEYKPDLLNIKESIITQRKVFIHNC